MIGLYSEEGLIRTRKCGVSVLLLYAYTIKPPAMLVVPLTALALDKKTSNDIISVGPKPHYI